MQKVIEVSPVLSLVLDENQIDSIQVTSKGIPPIKHNLKFYHYIPVWKTLEGAIEKYSPSVVLSSINADIATRIKRIARDRLPWGTNKQETRDNLTQLYNEDKLLVLDQQFAIDFIPGIRETSSPMSLVNRAKQLAKEGRSEEARKLKHDAALLYKIIGQQIEDALSEEL